MATTPSQRQAAIAELGQKITQSRQYQNQARDLLNQSAAILNPVNMPSAIAAAISEMLAELNAGTGNEADKIQQALTAALNAEATVLVNSANAGGSLWDILASVNLSAGIADPNTKASIKIAVNSALS